MAFFQVQIQLVFSLYDCNAEYKKIIYWFWCQLFNPGVSKIAYLIIYLGMNVVSQFYWSHNLILFSFVIRDSKRWKKKGIYYFQLKLKNWISHLSQQTAASEQWDYVYVGIKTIVEYKHALKQKGIKTLSAGTQSSKYWSVWKKKKKQTTIPELQREF